MEIWSICLLSITSLIVIAVTHWIYRWRNPKYHRKLPPGSMGLPLIGETIQFMIPSKSIDIPIFFKKRLRKYGPLFRTSLMGRPIIVSSDAEFNHYLLRQEGKLVETWFMDSFSKLLSHDSREIYSSDQSKHKYQRSLVLDHFGLDSIKEKLMPQLETSIRQRLEVWSEQTSIEVKSACSSVINETSCFCELAVVDKDYNVLGVSMFCDISTKILFSYDPEKSGENLGDSLSNIQQAFMSIPLNIPGTAFHKCLKAQKKTINLITELLNERRRQYPDNRKGDYLDKIVEDLERGYFWTQKLAIYSMFGLMLASLEGIASTLALAIKFLTENPSIVQKMTEENEAILRNRENKDSGLTWKEYKSMTYTRHVVDEANRFTVIVPGVFRKAITDIRVNGYRIPKGWIVMTVMSTTLLNADTYRDPLTFDPSRWENMGSIPMAKSITPFGGGSRPCAGAEYSKVAMAIFLHVLGTEYRWTKIKGGNIFRFPFIGFGDGVYIKLTRKHTMEHGIGYYHH